MALISLGRATHSIICMLQHFDYLSHSAINALGGKTQLAMENDDLLCLETIISLHSFTHEAEITLHDELLCFQTVPTLRRLIEETVTNDCPDVNVLLCVLTSQRTPHGWFYQLVDSHIQEPELSAIDVKVSTEATAPAADVLALFVFDPRGAHGDIPQGSLMYVGGVTNLVLHDGVAFGTAAMGHGRCAIHLRPKHAHL